VKALKDSQAIRWHSDYLENKAVLASVEAALKPWPPFPIE
jgi:Uri superfamily endonuclease